MKKVLLLFLGILCSLGMFADDILFSMSSPTGPTDKLDSKASADLVATFTGGSAIVYNGKNSAASMVGSNQVKLSGSSASYLKITMSGNTFQEGDSILISTAGTFYISSSNTKGTSSCDENGKYIVAAKDALIGGTDVYIWKSGGSSFASVTIVRPTTGSSSEGEEQEEPTVESVETPTFASINGTVAISCATDGATVQYSLDGTNYSNYTIPVTLTSNGKVYAKASVGTIVSEVASIDVTAVVAKEGSSSITLYYNTTDMTAASDAPKGLTGNAGTDYEGWGVSVAANTSGTYDKSLSYGSEINGNVTLKGSNGRQTIITMPEGVKANRITLYSYVNNSDTDKDSYWKEVCGTSYNTESEIALASRAAETPDVRVFALDDVTSEITLNNAGYQQCFYAVVDYTKEVAKTTYAITATTADATMGSASVSAASVEEGSSVTATATANTGYDFVNWTVDGTEVSTSASYEFTPTAATDLVANFKAHQYFVQFIADGNPYASVNVLYGESINPNLQAPDKTGYTFKGWDPEIPAAIVEDMTFNAVYEVNKYNLTFIVDGKETTYQVAYGALIPDYLPSDISKEGYTCTGWSPSLSVKMPAEDVTYTAQFTKKILVSDFALAATTATVDENGTTTVKYTTSSTGTVSATSSSENVTVSVDESAKTITITGVKAGEATIIVHQKSDDDYYGSEHLKITVTVNAIDLTKTLEYKVNGSLTFGYDATASREVYEFGGIYNNQVYGTPTTNIVAGKPYIVTAGDDLVLTYKSDATELTNADLMHYNGFWGVLGDDMAVANAEYLLFFNGNLYYATEDVANANMVPAGHAFFYVPEIPTGEPTGTAKALFGFNLEDYSTGINTVTAALKSNTPVYNISGQRVNSVKQGGVYLVNGKKVVVK